MVEVIGVPYAGRQRTCLGIALLIGKNQMKQGADWLAWSLQFIGGFFVGALIAVAILSKAARHAGMTQDTVVPFILGPAFIGAGLASYFGDRLWIGDSYRIIPPDEIRQSDISRVLSISAGILGGSLVLLPWFRHLQIFSR